MVPKNRRLNLVGYHFADSVAVILSATTVLVAHHVSTVAACCLQVRSTVIVTGVMLL